MLGMFGVIVRQDDTLGALLFASLLCSVCY
jgi:hypothetical protein